MFTSDKLKNVRHGFFSRQGGVSQGFFASLNFTLGKGDPTPNVLKNREIALQKLGAPTAPLLTVNQVHSADVIVVKEPWEFKPFQDSWQKADALVTNKPGMALGIQTSDCVPILLADLSHGVIGAVHAGWRGAQKGIIKKTIQAMQSLGAAPHSLIAAIGPSITQESYEVGDEVYKGFMEVDHENSPYFKESSRKSHFLFNLPGFVRFCLEKAGLTEVEDLGFDTYSNPDLFFSCRRATHNQEPTFGGGLSAIIL